MMCWSLLGSPRPTTPLSCAVWTGPSTTDSSFSLTGESTNATRERELTSGSWRTRDIEGNLFRQAKSNSKPEAGPPRDKIGTERYAGHLPFQTFCCESGTHVVDPEQSYYRDIKYRASPLAQNMTIQQEAQEWDPETQCMDSTQMWFCRDLWADAARGGLKNERRSGGKGHQPLAGSHKKRAASLNKRQVDVKVETPEAPKPEEVQAERRQLPVKDKANDAESGTDMDAIEEDAANPAPEPLKPQDLPKTAFLIPNSAFTPARILVNPRCVTTYGGVSHLQLALDLFGNGQDDTSSFGEGGKYVLEDWAGPPDSFVCQEMRTTGGRTAPKSQRRVGFLLQNEVSFPILR
jgi:hypothetical protein